MPFLLYEVYKIFKIKFEKYFLSTKFPSVVTFHIYLHLCKFFLHTTLDVLLMQQTQSFLQNKTKIVGFISKINSKDKYYHLKSKNHLSSNLLKWKWKIRIYVLSQFWNTENSFILRNFFFKAINLCKCEIHRLGPLFMSRLSTPLHQ